MELKPTQFLQIIVMEVYMCTDGLWDGVEDKKPSRLLKDAKTHIKSSKESSSPTGGKVGRKGEKS